MLVADDDPDLLRLVAFSLEQEYEIVSARDGEEALQKAADRPPDLAVLDLKMPKVDGLTVMEEMRRREATRATPVFLLSADTQDAKINRCLKRGVNQYIKKPFSPEDLLSRVRAQFRGS